MAWEGWFTVLVLIGVVAALARELAGADLIVMFGLVALASVGVLTPAETFQGFSNPAVPTIGALFIVSAGLRETGVLEDVVSRVFGGARQERPALLRMCPPIAGMSAFLNNAPIVAMMTPVVIDWAQRHALSPSRLLIPLSYAAMLGSTTTLIGTSVILTVAGLMHTAGMVPMGFFELAWAGVPICTVGLAYLIFVASRRLPRRLDPAARFEEQRREYTTNMRVDPDCRLIGSSIEEAGLRHLQGLFLVEIDRGTHIVTPVSPDEVVCEGDHLVFAGVVSTIATLQRIPGLTAVEETTADLEMRDRRLIEAVVSNSSPLIGQSIRDASFRTMYDAAVIAVHRNGERVGGKIGDVVLRPGDTLLLQTGSGFLRVHRNSQDFFLVSEFDAPSRPSRRKRRIAVAVLAVMVASVVSGLLPISIAAFLAAGALVATRCLSGTQARQSVEWGILIVIGAGFGIAFAMEKTGTAGQLAQILLVTAGPYGPLVTLAVIYAATLLLAELLHHAAAAAIMFPVAIAAATQLGVEPRGFAMGVALAATCAFANPTTYQTHLIVYGPGGYRFADFVRVGLPLDALCGAVALFCIPRAWPF